MSTPTSAEVLAALDFPTPCSTSPCTRDAATTLRLTHRDTWEPCTGYPLCEIHAETWGTYLGAHASGGVVCTVHRRPVTWRWES